MTFASIELAGVRPDGTDYRLDGLIVVAIDDDRMILEKPDEKSVTRERTRTTTRRRSYAMHSVKPGTRATVRIDEHAFEVVVAKGYGRRLSLRRLEPAEASS